MSDLVLSARELVKTYGHVHALSGASLDLNRGEIVALVGDNGAGKSTLMRILAGTLTADAGELTILGKPIQVDTLWNAQHYGIDTVYQDLALAHDLSIRENVFLGRELVREGLLGKLGVLAKKEMARRVLGAFEQLGVQLPDLSASVNALSGGQRQAVAIARSMMWSQNGMFLDEPTAALGHRQTEMICELIRVNANRGLSILVISHDLPRMLNLADRFLVMRHGRIVADLPPAEASMSRLLAGMLGEAELAIQQGEFANNPTHAERSS